MRVALNSKDGGFTLIELMIVIGIILILVGIAIPNYQQSIKRSKEATLSQDLYTLRQAIDSYTMDKDRGPQSLDDLVTAGYIRSVPIDPITRRNDTWVTDQSDDLLSVDQTEPGITDVHSGSNDVGSDGRAYSQW
jgi:general secretion pathway protein G